MKHSVTAIIYDKRGRILSIGQNSYVRTHPLQVKYAKKVGRPDNIYIHAEIHAITKCKNLKAANTIKVFRYNKAGKPVLAKPCDICQSAIGQTPIKTIEHT